MSILLSPHTYVVYSANGSLVTLKTMAAWIKTLTAEDSLTSNP